MTTTEEDNNKYLIFALDQNLYGVAIGNVSEIIEYQRPTKIPNLPSYIHGLLNLRGKVLPIIDFNLYLGQTTTLITKKTSAVIINYVFKNQVINLGVLVDDVLDVVEIPPESLEHVPDLNVKIKSEFIKNMFVLNEKIVILFDVNQVFSENALNVIADIPANK
jgi:purine-binding chemotaxis protein CheW